MSEPANANAKIPQQWEELEAHLAEQLQFLEASCALYDNGDVKEAKRLASTIRLLVHHKGSNKALLAQLGRLESTRFFDSAIPEAPGNELSYSGLLVMAMTDTGTQWLPMLDDHQMGPGGWSQFSKWWEKVVFVDQAKRRLSRSDVVLTLANQDGGSHVDPALDAAYSSLSRNNSLGWMNVRGSETKPMDGPQLASVRQIAHEVLKSLREGYTKSNPDKPALMYFAGVEMHSVPGSPILPASAGPRIVQPFRFARTVGRNALCPCGSGKKYKRCHGN